MSKSYELLLQTLGAETIIELLSSFLAPGKVDRIQQVIAKRLDQVWLVVENLYDPLNGAALVRTAEALGILHVAFIQERAVKALPVGRGRRLSQKVTIGAERWMDIVEFETFEDAMEVFSQHGLRHYAAVAPPSDVGNDNIQLPQVPIELTKCQFTLPMAVWFGNERWGLSQKAVDVADVTMSIPLYGFSQSLNLSVSVGIVLYQIVQVLRKEGYIGDLLPEKQRQWVAHCMLESVDYPEALLRELYARHGRFWPL